MLLRYCPPLSLCGRIYALADHTEADEFRCPECGCQLGCLSETAWLAFSYPLVLLNSPDLWTSGRKFDLAYQICEFSSRSWHWFCLEHEDMRYILHHTNPRQCDLLRDILGNPFHRVSLNPAWRTPSVTAVARAVDVEGRFRDLPILADALEEAGCTNADILDHCRQPGEHTRGCWLVDLVLEQQ
jgi:hypothetical protein